MNLSLFLALALAQASTSVSPSETSNNFADDWRSTRPSNFVSRITRKGDVANFRWLQVNERDGSFWVANYTLTCKTSKVVLASFAAFNANQNPRTFDLTPQAIAQLEALLGRDTFVIEAICSPAYDAVKPEARTVAEALAFTRQKSTERRQSFAEQSEKDLVAAEDGNQPFYTPYMQGLPRYKIGDSWRVTKDNSRPNHDRTYWRYYFLASISKDDGLAINMRAQTGDAPFPMGTVCRATTNGERNARRVRDRYTTLTGGPQVTLNFFAQSTQDYVCSIRLRAVETAQSAASNLAVPTPYIVQLKRPE